VAPSPGRASFVHTEDGWVYRVDEGDDVTIDRAHVEAAIATHVPVFPPLPATADEIAEEFAAYKATMQAAIAQRDAVGAAQDDWLLDLEFRVLDMEGA
jgi:hypothetical protein